MFQLGDQKIGMEITKKSLKCYGLDIQGCDMNVWCQVLQVLILLLDKTQDC